jgi:hypothetical protein
MGKPHSDVGLSLFTKKLADRVSKELAKIAVVLKF